MSNVMEDTTGEQLAPPERSLQQRVDALKRANWIRTTRADFKRNVKVGRADPLRVIADTPEEFLTMKVFDLMMQMPKYGRVKVNKILTQTRISPSKTLGGLSERQRGELLSYLRR